MGRSRLSPLPGGECLPHRNPHHCFPSATGARACRGARTARCRAACPQGRVGRGSSRPPIRSRSPGGGSIGRRLRATRPARSIGRAGRNRKLFRRNPLGGPDESPVFPLLYPASTGVGVSETSTGVSLTACGSPELRVRGIHTCGFPRLSTGPSTGSVGCWGQVVHMLFIHSFHRRFRPQLLNSDVPVRGLGTTCGFLEESTGCPRIHAQCAQLARIWGPSWGRAVDAVWTTKPVHSRPRFILELSPGHPQADTRCELRKQAESTVSTGPITTPVLHLENFSSKQAVWTSLERTAPPDSARRETRRVGEAPGERSDRGPHTALPLRTDLSSVRRRGAGPSPVRAPRRSQHRSPALAQPPGPRHPGHCPKRRNPVLTTGRTSGFPASMPHRGGGQAPPGRREVGRRQLLEVTRSGSVHTATVGRLWIRPRHGGARISAIAPG